MFLDGWFASSWSIWEGTIFSIDSIQKKIDTYVENVENLLRKILTYKVALSVIALFMGYKCCSILYIAVVQRRRLHNLLRNGYESLQRPKMYPEYVPHDDMISSIEYSCTSDGGVQILWGISGGGKSTYLKEALRNLVNEKKINGCIFVEPLNIHFNNNDNDGGSKFLNALIKDPDLLPPNEIFSHFLDRTLYSVGWQGYLLRWKGFWASPYDRNKKTVLVFDQFDNNIPKSEEQNHFLNSWLKNLAEQSNKTDNLVVLIATTDEHLALRLINLNNRVKFKLVDHCKTFQWTSSQVSAFFELVNVSLSEEDRIIAEMAGTPHFCANYLKYLQGHKYVLQDPASSAELLNKARETNWEESCMCIEKMIWLTIF